MPRTAKTRGANGAGSIRQISIKRNGKQYKYWQARYTTGYDPGTGRQIQHTISGKTQKEVAQKLRQITHEIDDGTYQEPKETTLAEWATIWRKAYLGSVKPSTADSYRTILTYHIVPALGGIKLTSLKTHQIQMFYNNLKESGVSPKTIKNIHGVLHRCLQQSCKLGDLRNNPASACQLPRVVRKEITPLDSDMIQRFLTECACDRFEEIYKVALFTGMREGEVLGLTWDCIDFANNIITVKQQLQKERRSSGAYIIVQTKNSKARYLTVAPLVMNILRTVKERQEQWKDKSGIWYDRNLVFTNEVGQNVSAQTVYTHFKKLAAKAGVPHARFHDLRHSYAVAALRSGDDIKTVQENLGHHTAAFTLDVYGHATIQMKRESANRMNRFMESVMPT